MGSAHALERPSNLYILPEVREFIKDAKPKTNTTRQGWARVVPSEHHTPGSSSRVDRLVSLRGGFPTRPVGARVAVIAQKETVESYQGFGWLILRCEIEIALPWALMLGS